MMSDYIWKFGDLKIEVWETNKAHALGYCKWSLAKLHSDIGYEILESSGTRYMLLDDAIIQAFDAFYKQAKTVIDCACDQYYPLRVYNLEYHNNNSFSFEACCIQCATHEIHNYGLKQIKASEDTTS